MADLTRLSSPSSTSSPGRTQPIARPNWPWATRTYPQRSAQSSPHPLSGVHRSNLQIGWETRSSFSSVSSQLPTTSYSSSESTRQWSFTGFEWTVRDVDKLRNFVEGVNYVDSKGGDERALEDDDFEILKQSPMIGDNKYKLEIAPTAPVGGSTPSPSTLSLYITSLVLDYAQGDYETPASMMAAIKCQEDRVGERGARPEWIWEFWQSDWVFRRESEVWECPLPSLSALLENSRISDTDSMVICVQIHCPVGPSIPQQPFVYYVPRDLLDGLEASLDNPNTGDVRFICLERLLNNAPPNSEESQNPAISPFHNYTTARKRIIYAHSDILIRRSDYFAAMLSSSFSENAKTASGERKLYTVVVEEADFETIYWLLKYCYANWLLFKQDDDPRVAIEGIGAGWSPRWLDGRQDEWEWKRFKKAGLDDDIANDARSATSADSLPVSGSVSRSTSGKSEVFGGDPSKSPSPPVTISQARVNTPKSAMASVSPRQGQVTSSNRRTQPSNSNSIAVPVSRPSNNLTRTVKPTRLPPPAAGFTASRYPVSPRSSRHLGGSSAQPDPHAHPTPAPGPASALSIYQVAHRYVMPSLASLALEHIMSTITPGSAFALLLATSIWDELHSLIEDFVVDRWDEVSASTEFEHCCQEIAAGEWGTEGGKTLTSVFRRLKSPS